MEGYKVLLKSQTSEISFTAEATTTTDNLTYTITAEAKRIIGYNADVVVYDGGVETLEDYALNRVEGTVTFATATERTITIDGAYVVLTDVAEANSFDFSGITDMGDISAFGIGWRLYKPRLNSATVTIGGFHQVNSIFLDALIDKAPLVLEFYPDGENLALRMFAHASADSVTAVIDGEVTENITFQGTGKMILEA